MSYQCVTANCGTCPMCIKWRTDPECIKLNKVYVETRYPDAGDVIPAKKFSKEDAAAFVNLAEEILSWLKKKL